MKGSPVAAARAPADIARVLRSCLAHSQPVYIELPRDMVDAPCEPVVPAPPLDFDREDIDVAIRFGDGSYPGLVVEKLFHDTLFPVCSPELLKGTKKLREPKDLLQFTLIHLDWEAQGAVWPNWRMWMLAAGVKDFNDTRGLHFSQTSLALQAAIDGNGVALGDSTLVGDDLASGRLVKPFELSLRSPAQFAYHLITRRDTAERPMTKAFRNWIIVEAAKTHG